jgi:hypothetical protein
MDSEVVGTPSERHSWVKRDGSIGGIGGGGGGWNTPIQPFQNAAGRCSNLLRRK